METRQVDRITKLLFSMIALLLLVNLLNSFLSSKPVLAMSEDERKGRYMIAAWGVQAQNADPRSGYYILDTVTGMVVASKVEVHRSRE